jgi:DNA-binding XRE family transcriptional regulator
MSANPVTVSFMAKRPVKRPVAPRKPTEPALKRDVVLMRRVLAERLSELRLERELSQAALALYAGIDRKTINRIENGHFSPALDTIVRLSVALDISPSALLEH